MLVHQLIFNLKRLNQYIPHLHFKIEGLPLLQDMLLADQQETSQAKIHLGMASPAGTVFYSLYGGKFSAQPEGFIAQGSNVIGIEAPSLH